MGIKLGSLISAKEIALTDLSGKIIGIDGCNVSYQFLAKIRQRITGEPLKDKKGRITSHLLGIFYRTSKFVEVGIKPVFVWDGKPPKFKKMTIESRKAVRAEALKKWAKALERGEDALIYAQSALSLTPKMVEQSIKLLTYMGIPSVRAPSEGEAQLAVMTSKGDIWASASQDWDSIMFGSKRLIRNLSITGRRKLPRKHVYIQIKPKLIELDKVLKALDITREQLIMVGMLVGTDYNPRVSGVGPKTAIRLVKKHESLDSLLANIDFGSNIEIEKIHKFFLNPPQTNNYNMKWKEPNIDKLINFMVEEHGFSLKRINKVAEKLKDNFSNARKEGSLEPFLN